MQKSTRQFLRVAIATALTFGAATSAFADPPAGRGRGHGGFDAEGSEIDLNRPGNRNGQDRGDEERGNGNGNGNDNRGNGGDNENRGNGNGNGNGNENRGNGNENRGNGGSDDHPGRGLALGRNGRANPNRVCGADNPIEGPDGQSGASHVAHVNFAPVEGEDGETESDSWARMMYFWIGSEFSFVLNAHDVEPGSSWTLVAGIEGEDGTFESVCLGDGTANPGGQLHINANFDPESNLPPSFDPFAEDTDETDDADEVTLSLVPSDAVDCETGALSDDLGDTILESEEGIRFVDTDELECPEDEEG